MAQVQKISEWNQDPEWDEAVSDDRLSEDELTKRIYEVGEEIARAEASLQAYLERVAEHEQDVAFAEAVIDALADDTNLQLVDDAEQVERQEETRLREALQHAREVAQRVRRLNAELRRLQARLDACDYVRRERRHITRAIQALVETAEQHVNPRLDSELRARCKHTVALGQQLTRTVPAVGHQETPGAAGVSGLVSRIIHFMAEVATLTQQTSALGDAIRIHGSWLQPFVPLLPPSVQWPR